jgi:predicted phosphodiesterase
MDSRTARSKEGVMSVGEVSSNGRDTAARRAFKVGTRVGGENDWENSAKESSDIKPSARRIRLCHGEAVHVPNGGKI